jgi:hypothetical protein
MPNRDNALPLRFDGLPDLPQVQHLRRFAEKLWRRDDVIAIWLGGSLAAGGGDKYSDLDLRVAIEWNGFGDWKRRCGPRDWDDLLDAPACVAVVESVGGEDVMQRFLVLANGDLYDLALFKGPPQRPEEHEILILCSRDDALAGRLRASVKPRPEFGSPAEARVIEKLIGEFWLNSHKHRKVLARGLELLVPMGLSFDRERVARLWHASISGMDIGDARPSIHVWGRMMRTIQTAMGAESLRVLGAAVRSREELIAYIEQLRREVADHGRRLAARLAFEYPEGMERAVVDCWREFLGGGD